MRGEARLSVQGRRDVPKGGVLMASIPGRETAGPQDRKRRGNVRAVTTATAGKRPGSAVFFTLLATSPALLLASIYVVFLRAPIEATMGIVQKIFYFHVPAAYSMYIGATACFVGSVG